MPWGETVFGLGARGRAKLGLPADVLPNPSPEDSGRSAKPNATYRALSENPGSEQPLAPRPKAVSPQAPAEGCWPYPKAPDPKGVAGRTGG